MCTHRQCGEPEFRLYLAKQHSADKHYTTPSLIEVAPLKVVMYLIIDVHNTLFTNPTSVDNERKVKCKKM